MDSRSRKRYALTLRIARRIHRTLGIALFAFFAMVGTTGLLLGWKKHTGGYILPKSYRGTSTNPTDWLPIHVLHERALVAARTHISPDLSPELERIDLRPSHGMVKFVFVQDYWGIQLDCATGELLHVERRRSDFIENIHDGSILDYVFRTNNEQIKLAYTSVMGSALLTFTVTGFWLWFGPRRMRSGSGKRSRTLSDHRVLIGRS